jgi:hypothetical protein
MKTWIALCLSLVLCSIHVLTALGNPSPAPSEEKGSCCKPSRGHHCPATCCVDRDTTPTSESSPAGLPAQASRVTVDTPTLLALAWVLSAPHPAGCPSVQDSPSAVVDAAMPLFLRHGVLLI